MDKISKEELNALSDLVEQERSEYLRRSSLKFMECAVNLCVTHMPLEYVADLLEEQANQLREHM